MFLVGLKFPSCWNQLFCPYRWELKDFWSTLMLRFFVVFLIVVATIDKSKKCCSGFISAKNRNCHLFLLQLSFPDFYRLIQLSQILVSFSFLLVYRTKKSFEFGHKSVNKIWFLILRNISFFAFLLLDSKCFWERYLCVYQFFFIQLCFLVLVFVRIGFWLQLMLHAWLKQKCFTHSIWL